MKWCLCIILIVLIMIIAKNLSQQYKDKYEFYESLKQFLIQFKLNLNFKQEKIQSFLKNFQAKKHFLSFIDSYSEYLKGSNLDLSKIKILDQLELAELKDIITSLGKYDVKSEINQLDGFLQQIEYKIAKANEDKNKLCPMIIKLSLLFAIGLVILLV